jgi:hypothetical protein
MKILYLILDRTLAANTARSHVTFIHVSKPALQTTRDVVLLCPKTAGCVYTPRATAILYRPATSTAPTARTLLSAASKNMSTNLHLRNACISPHLRLAYTSLRLRCTGTSPRLRHMSINPRLKCTSTCLPLRNTRTSHLP